MKKLLLTVAFCLFAPTAWAQCNGIFPANTLCGNLSGSPAPPAAFSAAGTVVGPGSSTTSGFAIWGNSSGTLLANPTDADPSLVHTAPVGAMLKGSAAGNELVEGISANLPNQPFWMQVRSTLFDANQNSILIQPLGGSVTFYSSQSQAGNPLIQVNHNFTSSSTYAPPGGSFPLGAINVYNLSDSNVRVQTGVIATSTDSTATVGQSTQSLSGYCFGENPSNTGCWPLYLEGHRMSLNDYAYGTEIAIVNRNQTVSELNPNNTPPSTGGSTGIQLDCGNGQPSTDYIQFSCSTGLMFVNNAGSGQTGIGGFKHGIVFRTLSIETSTYNPPDAIALSSQTSQAISWWTGQSSRAWIVYSKSTNPPASGPQSLVFNDQNATFSSHLLGGGGTPTASSCAGFAVGTNSVDTNGTVTFNTALSCSIRFNQAYTNPPFCTVSPGSAASTTLVSASTTVMSATFGTSQTAMTWACLGS